MSIKTTLHHYRFNLRNADEKAAYDALCRDVLEKIGFPVWTMRADYFSYDARKPAQDFIEKIRASAGEITLETECLFDDQWNTAPTAGSDSGLRVFNWAEAVYANKDIKEGYWIDQTPEMREVLRNTYKCGYCGHMEAAQKGAVFCQRCLGSAYLKAEDLHLTRMVPVRDTHKKRAALSAAERAHLLPLYREAQTTGRNKREKDARAKRIADENKRYAAEVKEAADKRDVALWLLNAPLSVRIEENAIFYSHTGRVCFGWRKPMQDDDLSQLLDVISEFPWPYDIKCADGRTLSGER